MLKVDYDVPDEARVAAKLLADDGELTLRGLRLLLDPEARAELKRLPAIGPVEVRDLMPELAGDYQRFFDVDGFRDHPAWAACYCSETNIGESVARSGRENRTLMTRLIEAGKVTALMAYVDGRPVGWCNYGLTTQLAGVMSKLKLEAADHDGVGSVACFVISPPYRRHGIAELLLEAACERLKARGCRAVEAYPRKESDDATSYRGPLGMFLGAGFEPYRVAGRTQIVRKSLL
jgi:GNAT superfamily N-acetyltransferase